MPGDLEKRRAGVRARAVHLVTERLRPFWGGADEDVVRRAAEVMVDAALANVEACRAELGQAAEPPVLSPPNA